MILQVDTSWPAALPLPFVDYTGNPRFSTIVTQGKEALIVRRSRFTRSYVSLSVSWHFNPAQFAAFKTFLLTALQNGASQFKIELRYPENSQLSEWAARVEDGYAVTYDNGIWRTEAILELVSPVNF